MGIDLGTVGGDHQIRSNQSQQRELQAMAEAVAADPYEDLEGFLRRASETFDALPKAIADRLLGFRSSGNPRGALLIRGLPTDPNLPDTPRQSERSLAKTTYLSELWLAVAACALGEPVGYVQEKGGQIFQNVCPTARNETMFSSESSRAFLPFHTELAFHPFPPAFVCLYCLRQDQDKVARTLVACIRQVLPNLTVDERHALSKPVFETGIDYSFGQPNATRGGGLITPVLYGDELDPYFKFDPDLMKAPRPEDDELLRVVNQIVNKLSDFVALEPGDLLIIDNRRAVHARSEFVARYDGRDRWLQRVCVVESLDESAADRNLSERIIRTRFDVLDTSVSTSRATGESA